ncbi:response regulator [Streptomyces sp. NPDC056165]|uniref:response regulator n=1 Tax=Streptomyces sp. NPDC056165 TaxID=3345733 RepID=UPI0035DA4B4C
MTRTLVVDDDFRVGLHSDYVRRVQDFEVVGEAATVAEALAAVRTLHPDLLLLDIFLPDGSGLDILRRLSLLNGIVISGRDGASRCRCRKGPRSSCDRG